MKFILNFNEIAMNTVYDIYKAILCSINKMCWNAHENCFIEHQYLNI